MITKVSLGLSKLIMERFRGCDRFYAVRQFYAKAIFVMDGLLGWQGGDTFPFCDWMTLFLWDGRVTHWRYHIRSIFVSSNHYPLDGSRRAAKWKPAGRQVEADGPPDGSRCRMPQIRGSGGLAGTTSPHAGHSDLRKKKFSAIYLLLSKGSCIFAHCYNPNKPHSS